MTRRKRGYTIRIDLYEDWIKFLQKDLVDWGYTSNGEKDKHEISIRYFNVKLRSISEIPRITHISNEFSSCGYEDIITMIKQKVKNGESLTPYLSEKICDPDYNDPLLNDWGIHHLHLGELKEGENFVERTDPLLFAKVTDQDFYMINVLNHGNWTNQSLVQIIHNNWPESIDNYRMKGVIDIEHSFSDSEFAELRNAGVFTPLKTQDGTIYMPIGGGLTTSGHSAQTITQSDNWMYMLKEEESKIIENIDGIFSSAKSVGAHMGPEIHFRLVFVDGNPCAFEVNSKYIFLIN